MASPFDIETPPKGLWLTDFDGTIKPEGPHKVSEADKEALRLLGRAGWFRAVATGRSLFNFVKAWEPGLELDALIFSSGLGFCPWTPFGPGPIIKSAVMEAESAQKAVEAARILGFGFFAYHQAPDNHHFYYERPAHGPAAAGFEKRLELFPVQSAPWPDDYFQRPGAEPLSQLMIMVPAAMIDEAERELRRLAQGLSVIRATSPFGDGCIWLEIFSPGISKGRAAADLADMLSLDPSLAVASGNDYNDIELLDWAGRAFITADAPPDLFTGRRQKMPPAGRGGLAWAVEKVLKQL